jgi:hypothetical protein
MIIDHGTAPIGYGRMQECLERYRGNALGRDALPVPLRHLGPPVPRAPGRLFRIARRPCSGPVRCSVRVSAGGYEAVVTAAAKT